MYADTICCATQARTFEELQDCLTTDTTLLSDYCKKWRLQPSCTKTVSAVFHLHNANASRELNVVMDGKRLRCEHNPVYLSVTLDRSLTFHEHLTKTAAKVRMRNNILSMLASTTWGVRASVLRSSALALCFATAEYCAPVCCSSHVHSVHTQLHSAMRTITGTVRSTPVLWLLVLSNIMPPHIRREDAVAKIVAKVHDNPALPLHDLIINHPKTRLDSRHSVWQSLPSSDWSPKDRWQEEWSHSVIRNQYLVTDPTYRPPGFDLQRQDWASLNRYCTGHGWCSACLHDWGLTRSPLCSCGQRQTTSHFVEECPLTKFPGGLRSLHTADASAVNWLRKDSTC